MKRLTGLDWPLLILAGCLLAGSLAAAIAITHFDDPNVGTVTLLHAVPYALAVWLVVWGPQRQLDNGRALASILFVALAMRLLLLPGTPVSTDVFRYVWDGRVQAAGMNPYLYPPADAALSSLRDAAIYPYLNRADYAPTIYPPTAQIVFRLVTSISEAPIAMKAVMLAFEALAVWAMLQLLTARGLPRARILLYAWHPLPLWEFARSGHIDIVAVAFLLLAFLAVDRRRPFLAGIALGAGALVKYFPIVAAPALSKRWDWRLPTAFVATVAILYLPYIGAGSKVFGFLGQYLHEEGFAQGSGIFLWQLIGTVVPLPANAFPFYLLLAAILMLALALFVFMREGKPGADLGGALLLAVTFTFLFSPHYSWYFAWLVPFLCFYPVVGIIYLTCACTSLYFAHWPPTVAEGLVIYGPSALMLIAEFAVRRRQRSEPRHGDAIAA